MKRLLLILLAASVASVASVAAEEAGFVPLFNGRDLTGWVNVNCAPETWSVADGTIHCTGHPTGALRTPRQYENFILEAEWRHLSSGGNSGLFNWGTPIAAPGVPFLRGIEVQVLDHGYNAKGKNEWYTTHGDVFPIHGATMEPFGRHNGMRSFPSEERSLGSPQWNHYRIVGSNGVLRLSVNGQEVSGGQNCRYRKGYLALESEGAPVEFRHLRIRELPSSGALPEDTAPMDLGWKSLFDGLDLRGWTTNAATASRWQVTGERLSLRDGTTDPAATLWTVSSFGDAEFILDVHPPAAVPGAEMSPLFVQLRGHSQSAGDIPLPGAESGRYQRYTITVRGRDVAVRRGEEAAVHRTLPAEVPNSGAFGLRATSGTLEFMNLYARDL